MFHLSRANVPCLTKKSRHDHVAILTDRTLAVPLRVGCRILGKTMTIDGAAYTVVGIASARLRFSTTWTNQKAIFVRSRWTRISKLLFATVTSSPAGAWVTRERARAELSSLVDPIMKAEGRASESVEEVTNLRETWTDFAARPLYFFAGAVLLVLLIACVNNSVCFWPRAFAAA